MAAIVAANFQEGHSAWVIGLSLICGLVLLIAGSVSDEHLDPRDSGRHATRWGTVLLVSAWAYLALTLLSLGGAVAHREWIQSLSAFVGVLISLSLLGTAAGWGDSPDCERDS